MLLRAVHPSIFFFWHSLLVNSLKRPIFLLPILIWFSFKPDNKIVITNLFFFGTLFHISLFGWIRHVTPIGMIAASIIVTLYHMPWFFLVCRWIPLGINSNFLC